MAVVHPTQDWEEFLQVNNRRRRHSTAFASERRTVPPVQQLSKKWPLHKRLPDDCLRLVDRYLALESLQARLRVFDCDGEVEHLEEVLGEEPQMVDMGGILVHLSNILLHDVQESIRHRSFGGADDWRIDGGPGPHFNMQPERRRALVKLMGSHLWYFADDFEEEDEEPLRVSDALDLADAWSERGHPEVHRRYGADARRRDRFASMSQCHAWWCGLLSPRLLEAMQGRRHGRSAWRTIVGLHDHERPVHTLLEEEGRDMHRTRVPASLELTELQQLKIACWPHRVDRVPRPLRQRKREGVWKWNLARSDAFR